MFSPASCFRLSQLAIRPRPDQVSPVLGSRYFTFASYSGAVAEFVSAGSGALPLVAVGTASSIGCFKYATLFGKIVTSSQPSSPASHSTSMSSPLRGRRFRSILRYSQSTMRRLLYHHESSQCTPPHGADVVLQSCGVHYAIWERA